MLHCTLLLYFDRYILLGQLFTTGMHTHAHILMLTLGSRKLILSVHHFLLATYAIGLSESYPVEILCLKHNLYVCKLMYKIFIIQEIPGHSWVPVPFPVLKPQRCLLTSCALVGLLVTTAIPFGPTLAIIKENWSDFRCTPPTTA